MKFRAYISGVQFIFEGKKDVPRGVRKLVKKGDAVGALNLWEQIRRGGESWDDEMGMPDRVQGQLDI